MHLAQSDTCCEGVVFLLSPHPNVLGAEEAAKNQAELVRQEAVRRKTDIDEVLDREYADKIAALTKDIQVLVDRIPTWESAHGQGIAFVQLVRGLGAFQSTLDAQDRVEASVDLFKGALPAGSDLNAHTDKMLIGGEIVESLHKWTKGIRDVPDSAELMVVLADHLSTWFDSQVEHGVNHEHSKRVRALFADLDFAGDKLIDRSLVEQVRDIGRQRLDIPVAPMGSAVSEGEEAEEEEPSQATGDAAGAESGVGDASIPGDKEPSTGTNNADNDAVVDVVELQQADPSARVQQAVRRRSVIRRRRRSSRVCDSVGAQSGRWNTGVDVTEFEAIVNDTIGATPDDAAWNDLCRTYIDVFTGARAAQIKRVRAERDSQERIRKIRGLFDHVDTDCNGYVDVPELKRLFIAWKGHSEADATTAARKLLEEFGGMLCRCCHAHTTCSKTGNSQQTFAADSTAWLAVHGWYAVAGVQC
eukprot:m.1177964 g.1177964  ORF g.1177964 m.1177964 type:complete len:473 (-) comp24525_c0_seq20:2991-4409(-)